MLQNYFTIALRNFGKHLGYTLLNVFGLAVSLAVAALIGLFVRNESSYDRWIGNEQNIFRVYKQWTAGDGGNTYTPVPLAPTLREQFPEIRAATRLENYGEALLTTEENKSLYVKEAVMTDSSFLAVIPFPLASGDPRTALRQPHSALLAHALARKLYGSQNPVGKIIRFNDRTDYKITGVLAPPAGNTHLEGEIFLNDSDQYKYFSWTGNSPATYVARHPSSEVAPLEQKITRVINAYVRQDYLKAKVNYDQLPTWRLQPLRDIHLRSLNMNGSFESKGDYRNLLILGSVAALVLLIAGINYTNLATAQATRRAREVGVRKVTGATRAELVAQFLLEAALQSLAALPLAVLLATVFLPAFNVVTDRQLTLGWAEWSSIGGYMLLLVMGLGLISGIYPAFFLSSYRPTEVLKGNLLRGNRGQALRRGLVVAQFTLAIAIAVVMTLIYQQVQYMQKQELGFRPGQVLVIPINTDETPGRIQALKPELLQNPRVEGLTTTVSLPGKGEPDYGVHIDGVDKDQSIDIFFTDADFARTLGLKMAQGRFFSPEFPSDTANAFVVNEAFVRQYRLASPVGHRMRFSGEPAYGTIVGVVRDFHFQGLQNKIGPLVFCGNYKRHGFANYAAIRLASPDIRSTVAWVEKFWKRVEPAHPMRYTFLDDDFAKQYADQTRLGQTLLYATFLTLFIASLGLFGLASFMAGQRTKEIGVRKVLGASVGSIVALLSKDFLRLVLVANVIAWPLAWYVTNRWLADFAYRIAIGWWVFAGVGGGILLIALLTVSFQAMKAAVANPVKSLRTE
ncbi:MAG: ABC transporter permease [Ferruginibacter sp.]|nr:ABC transporter permease [Cytophagales bacterium]